MKCRTSILCDWLAAAVLLALGLTARGTAADAAERGAGPDARTAAYELCIDQSPAQAGKLSPGSGTHRVDADAVVMLSAEPQPGYQFAYWLGDVSDPKAPRTTVQVNSSKVIVAVFQPANAEIPKQEFLGGGGGGGGGAVPTRIDLSAPGWSIAGGGGQVRTEVVAISLPPKVPTPVPEPTTIALLALGAVALRRKLR